MAVGGLLSGILGGAATGVDQVAKLSLEERAQQRKEDLEMKLATAKGGKGKGGSLKGWGTDTRTIDIDGEKVERMYRYNKDTGQVEDIITSTDLARYGSAAQRMFEAGMSPTEVEAAIMTDPDASKYYIPGTAFKIYDRVKGNLQIKTPQGQSGETSPEKQGYSWTDFIPDGDNNKTGDNLIQGNYVDEIHKHPSYRDMKPDEYREFRARRKAESETSVRDSILSGDRFKSF